MAENNPQHPQRFPQGSFGRWIVKIGVRSRRGIPTPWVIVVLQAQRMLLMLFVLFMMFHNVDHRASP